MLRSLRKDQGKLEAVPAEIEVAAVDSLQAHPAYNSSLSNNIMSQNFFSANREESKYLSAVKDALAVEQQMSMSCSEVIVASVSNVIAEAAFWTADPRMRNAKQLKDSIESNEKNFKEVRDAIEQGATEALESSGDHPNIAESAQEGEFGQAGGGQAQVAMPEVSGSKLPAPSASAQVSTPAPEVAAPAVQATPSINIVV